ncbi:hypothetical protein ACIHCM_22940 [Streptomyces sp. NPDC052023]|uniref:hypothetical protein n=1 Tax=Streptomyces sp. NPDC052023 TaxID=3365681 RepID=UPI0037D20060
MTEEPRLNDVRLGPDGSLEYFDGAQWRAYPDIPDDEEAPPLAVSRDDELRPAAGSRGYDGPDAGSPEGGRGRWRGGARGDDGAT